MKTFYCRLLRLTRLHYSKRHRCQKLRRFHLWQSVGDLTHFISRISKRWRSDTLHPETPVPTTTPPQLRWRACVLRALRPFRRRRDKQSDPSEVSVKRSRLAPAQVMSTGWAKICDWSLGFDGRGPMFENQQGLAPLDFSHEKRSMLLQSLLRISVYCLRPWNVDGGNGRNTRQHCH